MNIGILTKSESTNKNRFSSKMLKYFKEKDLTVNIYTPKNLLIANELLENNDFFVLKSKSLIFLYAGYFLKHNSMFVFPDPNYAFKTRNRVDVHYLVKNFGGNLPNYIMGTGKTLGKSLDSHKFPLLLKPLMGSGSKGIKIIESRDELLSYGDNMLYLEKYINGIHYIVYFIEDAICVLEKPPLSNEHAEMKLVSVTKEIQELITNWREVDKINFGHIDIVIEQSTNDIYVVDVGIFPEFSNWKCAKDPVSSICEIILGEFESHSNGEHI